MMADNPVMEERKERMVSPFGAHICCRIAHFLEPSVTFIEGPVAAPPVSCSAAPPAVKYKNLPFKVTYGGWKYPSKNWRTWVDQMYCLHHSTWKKSGIHDAIRSSTCIVHRYDDLIFRFVEKWCPETNSFVFPWGEASITLEDMMVLGGFSVLGESVLIPPGDAEMEEIVAKLKRARSSISKTKSKKAAQTKWITQFMGSQSEIEHEAFLAYWLSRFVFPFSRDAVGSNIVSIAVQLARGNRIALAPAVLACIYKSLTLLKTGIIAARKSRTMKDLDGVVEVMVPAPLALVQVWIWERFPSLGPRPTCAGKNEPRLARWRNLKSGLRYESVNIDSNGKDFQWRPYAMTSKLHMDNEHWAVVTSDIGEDLEGWVRCLRTSELVSLEKNCIEQYLPPRVAMQFGMDQDLPGHVARINETPQIAWRNYTRGIRDAKLYVPSRLYEPCVTVRYLIWWKEMILGWKDLSDPGGDGKSPVEVKDFFGSKSEDQFFPQPRGFYLKWKKVRKAGASGIAEEIPDEVGGRHRSPLYSTANKDGTNYFKSSKRPRNFVASSSRKRSDYNDTDPPVFAPKHLEDKASHSRTGTSTACNGSDQSEWRDHNDRPEDDAEWDDHNQQTEDNAQRKYHLSSTANNRNNIEEEPISVKPVESGVECMLPEEAQIDKLDEKTAASSGQVERNGSMPPKMGLETRISTIEKLVAYLHARKLASFG